MSPDVAQRTAVRADAGATAVEYCIMVAFIALAVVGGVTVLGTTVLGLFTSGFPTL